MNLASQIRHYLTFLAGLGGLLLSWHLIAPDQVEAVNQAGKDLIDPLTLIAGALAAGIARLAIGYITSFFSRGTGDVGKADKLPLWLLAGIVSTAAALGGLPSCAAIKDVPVRACLLTDQGTVCYSTKSGLSADVDARSAK